MLDEKTRLSISPGEGLGLFNTRMAKGPVKTLPAGSTIVSADNHFPLVEDIFYDRFPDHLKHLAPRIWYDEEARLWHIGANFQSLYPPAFYDLIRSMEDRPGCENMAERMKDLDAEGVDQEIAFPQVLAVYFGSPEFEMREHLFAIYNEYVADVQKQYPTRFFPVGVPNFWDPAKAPDSIRRIAELGLKSVLLPMSPGKRPDGQNVVYNSEDYDAMFAAIEEVGVPICFHIGEKFAGNDGINGDGARVLHDLGPTMFRKNFGQLVFGLIFDKFPGLKVVFAEAGINWVPGTLQDAEMIYNSHAQLYDSLPKHRPSWYWHNHCYATFMADTAGLKLLDIIGADRVMWSVDYPHNEGSFGYSQDIAAELIDTLPTDQAAMILGGTAREVFKLP